MSQLVHASSCLYNKHLKQENLHSKQPDSLLLFDSHYEGERAISKLISDDNNCSTHFDYKFVDGAELDLVTYNPEHSTFFLLHTTKGFSKLNVINKMYEYIYELKNTMKTKTTLLQNYTIDWYNKNTEKQIKSYFYGKNLSEILKKFFYGKTEDGLIIYNIKLNPKT